MPERVRLVACPDCPGYFPDERGSHPGACRRCNGTGLIQRA